MEIIQNINVENGIVGKLKKIKNSVCKEIKEKRITKRFNEILMCMLSEIWDLKNQINLEILVVKFKF